jgi:hypothetical protein
MKILFKYILKYKKYIDEYRLYVATTIQSDIDYMEKFASSNDFVKIIYCKIDNKIVLNDKILIWDTAYKSCQEDDTVYLKLDDDIVYLDETLFTDFINYRINNTTAPILYPVIINNLFISWFLQEKKIINPELKTYIGNTWTYTHKRIKDHILTNKHLRLRIGDFTRDSEVLCPIAWGNFKFCYDLHNQFIKDVENNNVQKYYLENIVLNNCEPVSINACSWIGSQLKKITEQHGNIYNDEPWLAVYLPTWSGNKNEIYGKCVVSHYAYYRQRELGLDSTDILDRYYNL